MACAYTDTLQTSYEFLLSLRTRYPISLATKDLDLTPSSQNFYILQLELKFIESVAKQFGRTIQQIDTTTTSIQKLYSAADQENRNVLNELYKPISRNTNYRNCLLASKSDLHVFEERAMQLRIEYSSMYQQLQDAAAAQKETEKNNAVALAIADDNYLKTFPVYFDHININLQTMHTDIKAILQYVTPIKSCIFCNVANTIDGHGTLDCSTHASFSDRIIRLNELDRCIKCLDLKHPGTLCDVLCLQCDSTDHHTALCVVTGR